MLVQIGPRTAIVVGAPNMCQASVERATHLGIRDHRDIEGLGLREKEGVVDHVPLERSSAVEVYFRLRVVEGVETDVGIGYVHAGLATVSINGFKPTFSLADLASLLWPFRRPRAVVLSPAHDIFQGILWV